ncbi:MAG: hypothetical protein IT373_30545 [Polyangiaceae bacterium]|nr:hypothetical protein [Polyangiaceae bacterium]
MHATTFWLAGVIASGALGVGCGGKAVIDGTAGGDGTGTTSSTDTTSGTTSNTTGSTGSTTSASTAADANCAEMCAALGSAAPWCVAGPTCQATCKAAYDSAGACSNELGLALQCMTVEAPATNCWFDDICQGAVAAYAECVGFGAGCGGAGCAGNGQDCACTLSCGPSFFEVECSYFDLQTDCRCKVNGLHVGNCAGNGSNPCDPSGGCCSAYF